MVEIDYLMNINAGGVIVHSDDDSKLNNLIEWLETPQGSVWGRPSWGNELEQFKHEPTQSSATTVNIEFSILNGVERDLPSLQITRILCKEDKNDIDKFNITICTPFGNIIEQQLS